MQLRIPIKRAYQIKGIGTVCVGRVVSGTLKRGDSVVIQPGNISTEIKTIELHYTDRKDVMPGDLVGFCVKNVPFDAIYRGMVVSHPKNKPLQPTRSFIAQIVLCNRPVEVKVGYNPYVHCHTASFAVKFVELIQKMDARGKVVEEKPAMLKMPDTGLVRLETADFVCIDVFSDLPALGRFVIRDGNLTVGFGVVKSLVEQKQQIAVKPALNVKSRYIKS